MAERRSKRILLLTQAEISNAMSMDEEPNSIDAELEKNEHFDDATDSEVDHESDFEYSSDEGELAQAGVRAEEGEGMETATQQEHGTTPSIYYGRDKTEWHTSPVEQLPRTGYRRRSVLHKVNLPAGKHFDNEGDAFREIFDDRVIDIVVRYTNIEATKHDPKWKQVDNIEMLAFIGLLFEAGADRSSKRNYEEFYGMLRGLPIFKATMSKHRFKHILRYIRFDDKDTRSVRRARDKLAPIRDVFDLVCANLVRLYSPGEHLTIDEQLMPFRGRCSFRQYPAWTNMA